jgi:hypothetical protein
MLAFKVEIPDLSDIVKEFGENAIREITFGMEAEFKARMAEAKSGNIYPRGKDRFHQASARGEAPAVDSGNLINSIMPSVEKLRGEIQMNWYGLYLDQEMNREFIMPSLDEVLKNFRGNRNVA